MLGEKLHPHGADPLPWDELAKIDAVYFTAGDADALRAARRARVLVATARELPTLLEAQVQLDALVLSARDPGEAYEPGQLDPPPSLVVSTMGREGGTYVAGGRSGSYAAAELPGPVVDAYGAGDAFAAGPPFALARGDETEEALAFAATLRSRGDDRPRRIRRAALPQRLDPPAPRVGEKSCGVGRCGLKWGNVEYPHGPAHASRRTRALN